MKLNDDAIKNLIGIQDIKQIRQGQLDGNKLKELIIKKHLISVTLGAIQKTKVVVALHKPIPNILIADYVLEMEEPYDFIVRIIKDILTRHTKIKGFNFNPVAKTCEFVILDNKPEKPELFKLRFMDNCFKPGQSGKLYQIFEYRGRPWFIHKLPNVDADINFLTYDGGSYENISCNCSVAAVDRKCTHKALVSSFLKSLSNLS